MRGAGSSRSLSQTVWIGAALLFCLLATLNTGGYRFGVSDQAFYLPAIQRHLDPDSFPRDRQIIDDQDRLNLFTSLVAAGVRVTGVTPEYWFAGTYLAALLLLFGSYVGFGRALGLSTWAQLACAAALTLRHRIGVTGANTLEYYGHPRMLAFAIGLWAVVAALQRRIWLSFVIVGLAFVVHPTTALWFGVWVGIAAIVVDREHRRWFIAAAGAVAAVTLWVVLVGPMSPQLVRMDAAWRGVLATKDYVFPNAWRPAGWAYAALYVLVVGSVFWWRHRRTLTDPPESGMVAGLFTLLALFLLTLPAVAAGIAIAVQFQVSRVFWMFDIVGTIYLVWAVADGTVPDAARRQRPSRRQALTLAVLVLAAVARGSYVKWVEHPERPVASLGLPADDWQDAMRWLRATPTQTLVLAHPGHARMYGTSVRVSAGRDVLLEEVKDAAMSMYSRRVALDVADRIAAIGDFGEMTAERARTLAARYGVDYLVTEHPLDLPIAYRNARFIIYAMRP
jgi:hypothetical protein